MMKIESNSQSRIATTGLICLLTVSLLSACSDQDSAPATTANAPTSPNSPSAPATDASEQAVEVAAALPPSEVFWSNLQTLCKQRYAGQLTIGTEESDRDFGYAQLRMHVERCRRDEIDINLSVDDDSSRTWMLRRTETGFSLHHEHIGDNGKPDDTSGYGGFTASSGTAIRQEFPADENTGTMIPAAATNVWAIEIEPGKQFAYELQRIEQQRMFRLVFDVSQPLGN